MKLLRWTFRQLQRCLALFGLTCLIYLIAFQYSCVVSGSMQPTLQGTNLKNGDRVLTEKVSYYFRNPRRWEVVTIRRESDGMDLMKRVVGLPGETLQVLRDGQLVIDGEKIDPPESLRDLRYLPVANIYGDKVVECGDGYYVLGDDSMDSDDSRYNGPISLEEIVGRTWLIIAPSERRGFVNP